MEGEAPSRRGGVKSIRSRSFYGLFGGYPGISQGPRSKLGEAEHEEGEECVEEEEFEDTEVAAAPEAPEAPNLALSNQPIVYQAEPKFSQYDREDGSIYGTAHSSSYPKGQSKIPGIQDSIHEGT
ncbi:hypothetical protein O181_011628 [Austropuccinia psidii MF-1]|uniref:Uncharacterized protein n=1 Tax=Austropuccinia psidii MF-1 TaxID=1389203 RepID=A0A9Q3BVN2_9BASI|nr:hypothetical protein [Austropuccinia psidii MF-1]